MSKIQAVTVMTLDGFLPEPDDVLTQWVMNHRKGFVHWREHCNDWILPHSILDLLCEKDHKNASFTYLAEIHDAESLELLRGLFLYNLVDEFIVYLFPYSMGKGHSVQNILPSYSVHFPVFCSCFSAFRRNDFGVKPVPSLQASGKLFWDARIISGAPKHNLPCSLEHEFFCRKIKIWRFIHFPPIKSFRRYLYHFLNTQNRSHRGTWAV